MIYVLEGSRMTSREDAHAELAAALKLPEYYGANLDALWDCLTEASGMDIVLKDTAAMLNALEGYGCKLLETFYDAVKEGTITFHAE